MDPNIMMDIVNETKRAIAKHGVDTVEVKPWTRIGCVLGEETGEVQQVILNMTRDNDPVPMKESLQLLYDEAKQVASVATRIMRRCQFEAKAIQIKEEEEKRAKA